MVTMRSRFDLIKQPDIQSIELWAQSLIAPSKPVSIHDLSAFGLKTPIDVMDYLKSPEGIALKAALALKIANEAHNLETQRISAAQQLQQKQALLFLDLFTDQESEKDNKEQQLNAAVVQLKKTSVTNTPAELQKAIDHYNQLLDAADAEEKLINMAIAKLEQKVSDIKNSKKDTSQKYEVYESHINAFHDFFEQGKMSLIKETLEDKLNTLADSVSEAIANNKNEQAKELMHLYNALILQGAMLDEVTTTSTNHYFDEEGKPTNSYKDAHFVIKGDERVVKHEGQYYLLKPGQDLNSAESKQEALQQFKANQRNIMGIKVLIQHYHTMESEVHEQRINVIKEQISEKETQRTAIRSQITVIYEALTTAETLKNSHRTNLKAPNPSAQLRPEHVAEVRIVGEQFKNMTPLTYKEFVNTLKNRSPQIQSFFYSNIGLTAAEMTNNPTSQIPGLKMAAFLKNIALLGRDPTNPAVTTIVNDYDKKHLSNDAPKNMQPSTTSNEASKEEENTSENYFNPSPLPNTKGYD